MLQERGLWKESIRKQCGAVLKEDTETDAKFNARKEPDRCGREKDCYAMRILENQSDFLDEKSQPEIDISKRGDECIFCQKFHCELDYILLGCSQAVYTRELHYSFIELEHIVRAGFNSVNLRTIRRF